MRRSGYGSVMQRIVAGAVSGAVGYAVINAATNLDMVIRGRPPSSVPQDTVAEVAEDLGLVLVGRRHGDRARSRANRFDGAGALMGASAGVGGGMVLAAATGIIPKLPTPVAGALVGLGVMAVTDVTAALLGVTDPRRWGPTEWAADVLPHLLYGWSTARLVATLAPHEPGLSRS